MLLKIFRGLQISVRCGFTFACAKTTASSRNTLPTAATVKVQDLFLPDDIFSYRKQDLHDGSSNISKALVQQHAAWKTVWKDSSDINNFTVETTSISLYSKRRINLPSSCSNIQHTEIQYAEADPYTDIISLCDVYRSINDELPSSGF